MKKILRMIIRLLTYFTLTFFAVNTFSQSLSMEDLEDWSDVKIEKVQKALRKKKFEMSDVDSSDVWVFNKENEKNSCKAFRVKYFGFLLYVVGAECLF
jgi:uncharacterized protein YxeA